MPPRFAGADYTTLDNVKALLKLTSTDTADDALIRSLITDASALIEMFCQHTFVPFRRSLPFDAWGRYVSAQCLDVDDLLEVVTITNGDSVAVSASAYVLRPGGGAYPKWRIELKYASNVYWTYSSDYQDAITMDAFWGYHEDYSQAFVDTLENVPAGGITSSQTTMTLTDVDAADARGKTRFAVLQYLRIENEMLQVTAVNTSTNVLTVARGVMGTTAAIHAEAVDIKSYYQLPDIQKAATDLTAWLYRNRDVTGERIRFLDGTQIVTNEAPANIRMALERYKHGRIAAG